MNIKNRRLSWVRRSVVGTLLLLLGATLSSTWSQSKPKSAELSAEQVLQELQSWIGSTPNLYAKFEQATQSGSFGTGVSESGELFLSRPNRMRWDYLDPERKIAIVDHGLTLLYLEEDEQMYLGQIDSTASLLPSLLTGQEPLKELFNCSLLATPSHGKDGNFQLRLEPKQAAEGPVQYVILSLDPERFAIQTADVMDGAGNSMRYRFSDYDRKREMTESLFQFQAPRGTEIIRQ